MTLLTFLTESGNNPIIVLITAIVGLIGTVVALIPTAIKLAKSLKEIAKNKDWKKIMIAIKEAVVTAEASGKSGVEKKTMVIETIKTFCMECDVILDEDLLNQVSDYIDTLISTFNQLESVSK